jgi:hypothetical protein
MFYWHNQKCKVEGVFSQTASDIQRRVPAVFGHIMMTGYILVIAYSVFK